MRIIGILEPVLSSHRLVVHEDVVREATNVSTSREYSLAYQLTHITAERNALRHDDRLEAVSGAVGFFARTLEIDTTTAKDDAARAEKIALIERWREAAEAGLLMGADRGIGLTVRPGCDRTLQYEDDLPEVWSYRMF